MNVKWADFKEDYARKDAQILELVEALEGHTKKCGICHGSGEYEQWPHLSPGEVDEIIGSGKDLPKSKTCKCTNCRDSIDLIAKSKSK